MKTPMPSSCGPLGASYRQLCPEAHCVDVAMVLRVVERLDPAGLCRQLEHLPNLL